MPPINDPEFVPEMLRILEDHERLLAGLIEAAIILGIMNEITAVSGRGDN